jgi:mannosyltransferase OCH1-like enzyme
MQDMPRAIFQTWKSRHHLPENFRYWQNTMKQHNPKYKYTIWDDADNASFINDNFPWFLDCYNSYPAEIYRADAIRYFYLYLNGGVYADMDTECLAPIDGLLSEDCDIILGRMGDPSFAHSIPNAIMLSRPRQEFWMLMMALMLQERIQTRPEYATGPVLLRKAVTLYERRQAPEVQAHLALVARLLRPDQQGESRASRLKIMPPTTFYPLNWNDPIHDRFVRRPVVSERRLLTAEETSTLFPKSVMVTYWAHSW